LKQAYTIVHYRPHSHHW